MTSKKNKIKHTNTIDVPIYTKSDYKKDEDKFEKSMKSGNVDFSNFQRLMLRDICTNTSVIENGHIGDIDMHDIELALKFPKQGWRILLKVSDLLMRISPHYFRMNNLYSNMALFCWWVDLYDIKENAKAKNIKKTYSNLVAKLENMNLKHEFSKIMKFIPYQDVYYGLVFENQSDFFFQQVDYKICELYQIQDGLYNFRIDLSCIKAQNIDAYPDYVQKAYLDFKDGIITSKWYIPPADKQICIKMNSQWIYPYPLLIGMIKDILDLNVYKKLKLQSARTDNYKAIAVEVPIDENTVDKPLLTPDTLGIFAEINRESMTDDIGLIHTLGSSATPISFKDSSNTRNNVSDAIDELYNSSGITKELYNGSSSATAGSVTVPVKENYTSNFKCSTDGNGKGILTSKVGLLTYDEAVHAGNYPGKGSSSYINSNYIYWLMSPGGADTVAVAWDVDSIGNFSNDYVSGAYVVRPVISLKAGLLATGSGTTDDPYLIQTR